MNKKLKPLELRNTTPSPEQLAALKRHPIYFILDDVLDTYNTGGIFRLADAVAAAKVYLCGGTEVPPNTRVKKASINTWQWVEWEYKKTALEAVVDLRKKVPGVKIIAVEQHQRSVSYDELDFSLPVALVVGNETRGVRPEVLDQVDQIVELPMLGVNTSLNVIVSLGIVAYQVLEKNGLKA